MLGWIGLILYEPDLGTSVAIALIAAVMVFAAGLHPATSSAPALLAVPALAWLIVGCRLPHAAM